MKRRDERRVVEGYVDEEQVVAIVEFLSREVNEVGLKKFPTTKAGLVVVKMIVKKINLAAGMLMKKVKTSEDSEDLEMKSYDFALS